MLLLTRLIPGLFFLIPLIVSAQLPGPNAGVALPSQIVWNERDSAIGFSAQLRPLQQIAGAPEAFYTYFWEFGDGGFSFDENPTHLYKDSGDYNVRLFATNNYDDGKAPPADPRKIKVKKGNMLASANTHGSFFNGGRGLQLKVNSMPRPDEEMMCIIGYRNTESGDASTSGSLVLFYNDKDFNKKNFGLVGFQKYNKEDSSDMTSLLAMCETDKLIPSYAFNQASSHGPAPFISTITTMNNKAAADLLMQKQQAFDSHDVFTFRDLKAGDERFIFATMHTAADMIKDTNATLVISAMMIPDNPEQQVSTFDLELQIVASHDPNRLMLRNRKLNYRLIGQHKQLKYQVHFQNTGKGPAKTIGVGIRMPSELEPASLEILSQYPQCIPCASARPGQSCLDTLISKDSIHFIFRNIYLPGVRQQGVKDRDSTKGFVEYNVRFKEKSAKVPFWSQAAIVFDKNEPVVTNKMPTRYMHGISPAIIAGYQRRLSSEQNAGIPLAIGAAIAPYSPYRFYLQAEAYLSFHQISTADQFQRLAQPRDTVFQQREAVITGEGTTTKVHLVSLDIVPLQLRKNLSNWFGAGAGFLLRSSLSETTTATPYTRLKLLMDNSITDLHNTATQQKRYFSHVNPAAFLDINIGRVRVGLALGVRWMHFFSPAASSGMVYAIWRL